MLVPGSANPMLLLQGGDPLDELGVIAKSLRLRPSAGAYLSRMFASGGNVTTWTWSGWVKRGAAGSIQRIFGIGSTAVSANQHALYFDTNDTLAFVLADGAGAVLGQKATVARYRDPGAHYHIVAAYDSANPTAADRMRLYVDGVRVTSFSATTDVTPGQAGQVNAAAMHTIGTLPTSPAQYLDGFVSHISFIDGQALLPPSFGQFHPRTVQWRPKSKSAIKAVADAGGINSFFLPFDDAASLATLVADASSKSNNWTANNVSLTAGITYDALIDTPTTNYPTLDPNFAASGFAPGNITDGGLKFASTTTYHFTPCTIPLPAYGKWYAEFIPQDTVSFIGVADLDNGSGASQNIGSGYGWYGTVIYTGNASAVIGSLPAMAANDIIGVAVDMAVPQVQWYKNGTLIATQALSALKRYAFACGDYYAPGVTSCFANFGQRPFSYLPAGYKPLCAKNLKYDGSVQVATSGTFVGNSASDGPIVYINGCPETLTINGNAVTFGVHADRLANGFKIRTASASYNAGGNNTWAATINAAPIKSLFRFQNAKGN